MIAPRRIAILGNAGSGKSFLARKLGAIHGIPVLDLDDLFWLCPGDYTTKRPMDELSALVDAEWRKDAWIVEGVYGELIEPFLARSQQLVWLDLPWNCSRERITARESRRSRALTGKVSAFESLPGLALA